MLEVAAEHVKRVRSVVQGRLALQGAAPGETFNLAADTHATVLGTPNRITRSWVRCLNDYHLDPGSSHEPEVVATADLQERQERLLDMQTVAKAEMANLYQQLAGSGYAIILTDREGVLLNYFGDPAFTHAASRTGLMPGAIWTERVQGTNGMGTCLFERRPVTVHQDEHYLSRNIGLSCAAAPIFDHEGELVGVLDASGESHLAQQHTLALVSMSVQMIENRVFMQRFRNEYIMRFHNRPEFIGTLSEGAIALSITGKVLAATRSAVFQLGLSDRGDMVGRDITELFNMTFCGLIDSSAKKAFHPVPVFETRNGARLFAVIMQPISSSPGSGRTPLTRTTPTHIATPDDAPRGLSGAAGTALIPAPGRNALDALHQGDPCMAAHIDTAKRLADRNVAILLQGETGTGKERFARAIHQASQHAHQPFIAINCASIPETLIESELFGYRPGAFTGASKDGQRGKLLQANGGTLFLDEIGDMPLTLQARLLRVLEEREVTALGSETAVRLDIHLISATHCDLQHKMSMGEFRSDLYYRLQGVTITLPPLRERADRRALIRRLALEESDPDCPVEFDTPLLAALERQPWPGNVRQLRHVLRTMIALRESACLTLRDLPPDYLASAHASSAVERAGTASLTMAPPPLPQATPPEPAISSLSPLESAERAVLLCELERHEWNLSSVARTLEISRNTLYRKLQRLDIKPRNRPLFH